MAKKEGGKSQEKFIFSLFFLASGEIPALTTSGRGCLAETASLCLESQGHESGVELSVRGHLSESITLQWEPVTDQMHRCWADDQEATEFGACGIAALLIHEFTDLTVVECSVKGTGFDYWLGTKSSEAPLFQEKSRLEVSGIRKGDDAALRRRVNEKTEQTKRSDGRLPAYVIVVEFSTPRSQTVKR
jgi:hypothetical protein